MGLVLKKLCGRLTRPVHQTRGWYGRGDRVGIQDFFVYPVMQVCPLRAAEENQFFFLLDLPATCNAMATACFCGFPSAISVLIFSLIVSFDDPFFNGINYTPESLFCSQSLCNTFRYGNNPQIPVKQVIPPAYRSAFPYTMPLMYFHSLKFSAPDKSRNWNPIPPHL